MTEISNISYLKFLKEIGISSFSQEKPNNFYSNDLIKQNNKIIDKIEDVKNLNDLNLLLKKDINTKKFIFGEGNENANIMLIGGLPQIEDIKNLKPFFGEVGKLLDNMLSAIKLNRKEIFITHVIPRNNNEKLTNEEILKYMPFIQKKIEIINPNILLLLGPISAKTILNSNVDFENLRGKWHDYRTVNMKKTIRSVINNIKK